MSHRRQSSPPPANINIVGDPVISINDQRSAVNVKVDVSHTQKATKISSALLHFMSILIAITQLWSVVVHLEKKKH